MPLFYFNFRDDDGALSDETGAEYMSIEEAKTAALKCLAEVARDQGAAPAAYLLERQMGYAIDQDDMKTVLKTLAGAVTNISGGQ